MEAHASTRTDDPGDRLRCRQISLLVAGFARVFVRRGLRVRPFKPQNMSNNAAVTADGGEIGRAQALQARAARAAVSVHMNPVLLKPQSDVGAQLVVQGRVVGNTWAHDYQAIKAGLLGAVLDSFGRLAAEADLVLVEGAGSASEVNLRTDDIANMGFARVADVPVVVVGDIDRGGVIASLVGTKAVIDPEDAAMIVGFIVNRFRGDPSLFANGMKRIADQTGWPALGLVPYFPGAIRLPAEDALSLPGRSAPGGAVKVVVLAYPHLANFDDVDPLRQEPDVDVVFVRPASPFRAMRGSSSCPVQRPPLPISPPCAKPAGTSTSRRISGAVATCWASAAAIRCSAGASPIPRASKDRPAASKGSACSRRRPFWAATRSWSKSPARP